ncbi:unnamed protein product [Lactuca virosa]|uniref:Auxin response factor n=1 Tax=Lactuca virosa TaxID=75947 RepID=A0AAU9PQC5_9ASTR|nr:unnamed protein product [Lactuca virosa]
MKEVEKSVDSQLWHACAGGLIQMPLTNSKVYYFPQGHAEHTLTNVNFSAIPRGVPPFILCKVIDVKFMADLETHEVYAKIKLNPLQNNITTFDDEEQRNFMEIHNLSDQSSDKASSFAKTLTQSDANNGGGFSVPRCCAETIFPRLDYSSDPPVQTIIAKDIHGEIWRFRHIYRGTPRRHLLTTGWSTFVNQKKLIAGDSIVFMRSKNGDLCVGIRRAKRGSPECWSSSSGNNKFMMINNGRKMNYNIGVRGKVKPEDVIEATSFAVNGEPFEVTYYPRASTPEFCVKASSLIASLQIQWCHGMRFKMAFETEDSSRISCFMGIVSSVHVVDPFQWPNSPWRLLQVNWYEPDLLQNVKNVSPWVVELLPNMPLIHLTPFSPHRKKLRLPQPPDLHSDNVPTSIQGARHGGFQIPLSDLNLTHKLQSGLFPSSDSDHDVNDNHDDISCLLTIGTSSTHFLEKNDNQKQVKTPLFLLFGQPIHVD